MTDLERILPTNLNFLASKNEKLPLLGGNFLPFEATL